MSLLSLGERGWVKVANFVVTGLLVIGGGIGLQRTLDRGRLTGSARQPQPGIHVWRTPHGLISLVTNQGTLLLGTSPYAQQIWHAAAAVDPPVRAAG